MKFVLAALSVLGVVSAAAKPSDKDLVVTQAQIQLGGLVHEPTAEELAILDRVVWYTFNKAYQRSEALQFESKETFPLGEDSTMVMTEFIAPLSGYCSYCIPDDVDDWECYVDPNCGRLMEGLTEDEILMAKAGKVHTDFETKLCHKLRKSGLENFAGVQDCSFSFVETVGTEPIRTTEKNAYEALEGRVTDAQIILGGLQGRDLSGPEVKFLESVVLHAHADAFLQTGYTLDGVDVTSAVSNDAQWIGLAQVMPNVHADALTIAPSIMAHLHATFEAAVCRQLAASNLSVFQGVQDCAFDFVYNPAKEGKTKGLTEASA